MFFLCFYCYEYEICKRKTREFFDCSTHHFLQLFSMYKKIFIFVKSLIKMFSNNVSSSNELNNILIDKVSFFFSTFLSRDDQHNKFILFFKSNASLHKFFREWWNSISYELKNLIMTRIRKKNDEKCFEIILFERMNLEIIISKLRFWLKTRFDCYVIDVISTWFILHQSIRKIIFCEIIKLIKRVINSSFKNIWMLTLKSHCKKYFMNLFSQIF
jgi:hypothetical protein